MPEYKDEAIVLDLSPCGESSFTVELMTCRHGRCRGLTRSRRQAGVTGTLVALSWRYPPRAGQSISFSLESLRNFAAPLLDDALRLDALASCCALLREACPEGEPLPELFKSSLEFITILSGGIPSVGGSSAGGSFASGAWETAYVRWELELLRELGFGLDLANDLQQPIYLTRHSCQVVAGYGRSASNLLSIPRFLRCNRPSLDRQTSTDMAQEVMIGLALTEYLLTEKLLAVLEKNQPPARVRFVKRYLRSLLAEALVCPKRRSEPPILSEDVGGGAISEVDHAQ